MKQGRQLTGTVGVPEAHVVNANGKQQSLNLEPHFKDALGKWISQAVVFRKSKQMNLKGSLKDCQLRYFMAIKLVFLTVSLCISFTYDDLIV